MVARYVLLTISSVVRRATDKAKLLYPGLPVLCSGGVASNSILRAFYTTRCLPHRNFLQITPWALPFWRNAGCGEVSK